tara:strand:- start:4847 stop:6091 length:1245 start_codon:yes stop_codon:yes gene_type:complete
MPKGFTWTDILRKQLKNELGFGWSVVEQSGNTKVSKRYEDDSRSSVMLPIEWRASNAREIGDTVGRLKELMDDQNVGLSEAFKLIDFEVEEDLKTSTNWANIKNSFLESRKDRRETTKRDLKKRIENALITLETVPKPKDGKSLFRSYAEQHFGNEGDRYYCPPGGQGRKRHFGDLAAFLRFAVDRQGAPNRWLPMEGDELQELIGASDDSQEKLTPPVKPEQLAALLDSLEADGKPELWLAVGLVGLFGLRPAELKVLRIEDEKLYVGTVKRNIKTLGKKKQDRLVLPLDIPGREGEGKRMLDLYVSGLVKMPTQIENSEAYKDCGDAFRQYLDRYKPWVALTKQVKGLTPYSLRHGYAWRGHKSYNRSIPIRDLSALMGHDPNTHYKHYAKWIDEQGLSEAVSLATGEKVKA